MRQAKESAEDEERQFGIQDAKARFEEQMEILGGLTDEIEYLKHMASQGQENNDDAAGMASQMADL